MKINRLSDSSLRTLARRCWPKDQHPSRGAADAHVRALLRAGREKDAGRLRAYRCRHCGAWHVGHVPEAAP